MKTRNLENRLAYAAALVALLGVLAAASSAFAAEAADTDSAVVTQGAAAEAINGAKQAMRESADEAAKAIKLETTFDLENQLSDISSTLIAANK